MGPCLVGGPFIAVLSWLYKDSEVGPTGSILDRRLPKSCCSSAHADAYMHVVADGFSYMSGLLVCFYVGVDVCVYVCTGARTCIATHTCM